MNRHQYVQDIRRRLVAEGVSGTEIAMIFASGLSDAILKLPRDQQASVAIMVAHIVDYTSSSLNRKEGGSIVVTQ